MFVTHSKEEAIGSSIVFRTMKLLLVGLAVDVIVTLLILIVHAVTSSSILLTPLPYLASAILVFSISSCLFSTVFCYLKYPKFRKAIAFLFLLTLVVLVVHLALIGSPATSFGYYVGGSKNATVPLAQIPKIATCQGGVQNDCESCSGCVMDETYYVPAAVAIIDGVHCAPQVEACNMEHPPLAKALIAVGIAAFGAGGFDLQNGRLLPIILGTACVPLVFAIGWKFSKNKKVAYYSSMLLALDTMFFAHSSISVLDIPVVFFALAAIVAYLYDLKLWRIDKYYISGALMGLAMLSKETAIFLVAALATFHFLRGKELPKLRLFSTLKIIAVAVLVFAAGLQVYDSLLTGGQVPTFVNQIQYIISYGSSLVCHPSAFDCAGAFLNVPNDPSSAITPLSWLIYYAPTAYFKSNVSVCIGSVCHSYVNIAYYGITNMIETWSTFLWAPFAAYILYRLLKRKEAPTGIEKTVTKQEPAPMTSEDMEKLAKLKSLLDSGALTKEEFDSQKSAILYSAKPIEPHPEEESQIVESSTLQTQLKRFRESDLAVLALVLFCWSYFPYLALAAEGRVTYPFYILPAVPAIALGSSYLITRPFIPRVLAILFLVAAFAWFVIFFPDQSFLPSWITSSLFILKL